MSAKSSPVSNLPSSTDSPPDRPPAGNHWAPSRRAKGAREPSGRVAPPAPAWMVKPLKPPAARRPEPLPDPEGTKS